MTGQVVSGVDAPARARPPVPTAVGGSYRREVLFLVGSVTGLVAALAGAARSSFRHLQPQVHVRVATTTGTRPVATPPKWGQIRPSFSYCSIGRNVSPTYIPTPKSGTAEGSVPMALRVWWRRADLPSSSSTDPLRH